jgi:CheY-like chemotaxis protein
MPGINGYQTVEQIKQITCNNELKVLFISGYTENKIVQELKANNDNYSFLSKPFDLKELSNKVREILG